MKNRSLARSALLVLLLAAPGCAPVWIAAGAVAGYAVSRDSVTLDLDRSWEQVWSACLKETRAFGKIKREDPKRGRLDATVEGADVVLTLKRLSSSTVRVILRARKTLLPKPEIAQRLGFAIVRRAGRNDLLL